MQLQINEYRELARRYYSFNSDDTLRSDESDDVIHNVNLSIDQLDTDECDQTCERDIFYVPPLEAEYPIEAGPRTNDTGTAMLVQAIDLVLTPGDCSNYSMAEDCDAGSGDVENCDAVSGAVEECDAESRALEECDAGSGAVEECDAGSRALEECDAGSGAVEECDAESRVVEECDAMVFSGQSFKCRENLHIGSIGEWILSFVYSLVSIVIGLVMQVLPFYSDLPADVSSQCDIMYYNRRLIASADSPLTDGSKQLSEVSDILSDTCADLSARPLCTMDFPVDYNDADEQCLCGRKATISNHSMEQFHKLLNEHYREILRNTFATKLESAFDFLVSKLSPFLYTFIDPSHLCPILLPMKRHSSDDSDQPPEEKRRDYFGPKSCSPSDEQKNSAAREGSSKKIVPGDSEKRLPIKKRFVSGDFAGPSAAPLDVPVEPPVLVQRAVAEPQPGNAPPIIVSIEPEGLMQRSLSRIPKRRSEPQAGSAINRTLVTGTRPPRSQSEPRPYRVIEECTADGLVSVTQYRNRSPVLRYLHPDILPIHPENFPMNASSTLVIDAPSPSDGVLSDNQAQPLDSSSQNDINSQNLSSQSSSTTYTFSLGGKATRSSRQPATIQPNQLNDNTGLRLQPDFHSSDHIANPFSLPPNIRSIDQQLVNRNPSAPQQVISNPDESPIYRGSVHSNEAMLSTSSRVPPHVTGEYTDLLDSRRDHDFVRPRTPTTSAHRSSSLGETSSRPNYIRSTVIQGPSGRRDLPQSEFQEFQFSQIPIESRQISHSGVQVSRERSRSGGVDIFQVQRRSRPFSHVPVSRELYGLSHANIFKVPSVPSQSEQLHLSPSNADKKKASLDMPPQSPRYPALRSADIIESLRQSRATEYSHGDSNQPNILSSFSQNVNISSDTNRSTTQREVLPRVRANLISAGAAPIDHQHLNPVDHTIHNLLHGTHNVQTAIPTTSARAYIPPPSPSASRYQSSAIGGSSSFNSYLQDRAQQPSVPQPQAVRPKIKHRKSAKKKSDKK